MADFQLTVNKMQTQYFLKVALDKELCQLNSEDALENLAARGH